MRKIINQEQIINRFKLIHGNEYDYSKVIYLGMFIKVCIVCPIHGEFWQTPCNHLKYQGCPICRYIKSGIKKRLTLDEFIKRARLIHRDNYDYSKVIFNSSLDKVYIVCPEHGEFQQKVFSHLSGNGCKKCFYNKIRLTKEEFIEKARVIHGDKFDYSKVNYINNHTKICIICPEHDEFWQTPANHLTGYGCLICNSSHGETTIKAILDKYNIENLQEYKIPEVVSQLKYDFYLPEYRILIEFHGIQHYEYIPFLHKYDEDNFLSQKDRDAVKKDNAIRYKYRLLEFNYKQLLYLNNEDFEQLIIKGINTCVIK